LLADREAEEWALADLIVAGSDFVAQGLAECGVDRSKIRVIPYGVDPDRFASQEKLCQIDGPLRVLFVGEVGLRKGVPYLLDALQSLGPTKVQAKFAGSVALDASRIAPYRNVAEFLGPVPRADMPGLYHWAQVFVLPSIVEGSATASYEALMAGLPVVATPNTGTVVRDGVEGFIIPARDARAIERAISGYVTNPKLLQSHSGNAIAARDRISVTRYGRDLEALFK
jgi:glycosyltransferase involved in cell wall biosynthesis